jgi:hypothetical protein
MRTTRKLTEQTKIRMWRGRSGYKHSQETIEKIRNAHINKKS